MKLTDYKQQSARHILIYGAPKSGKTCAVGKLAEKYRLWYFDLENSVKSLFNSDIIKPETLANVELFPLPDKQTFPVGIETILKVLKASTQDVSICHEHGKVSCPACKAAETNSTINVSKFSVDKDILVIDSWSQLSESSMNYIMRDQIAKDNFDAKPGWDEYGKQGRILERLGSIIQTAPFNIVVVSHELMVEMEDGSKKIVPIGGTSNASKVFAKYFDDVIYSEIVNKKHRLVSSTVAKSNVLAGSRAGKTLSDGDSLLNLFT